MKVRFLIAVVVAVTLIAAPAVATDRVDGEWDADLYLEMCPDGRLLSWAGSVEFEGHTYATGSFPLTQTVFRGPIAYFREAWVIFPMPDVPGPEALIAGACDSSQAILSGNDRGYCAMPWCGARGEVTAAGPMADPYGLLGPSFVGHRYEYGGVLTSPTSFESNARFHPGR